VLDMIPGLGGGLMDQLPDDAMDVTQERMQTFDVVMDSMTEYELENPRSIGASQIRRIARGSGTDEEAVRELLEQHNMMRRTLKQIQGMGSGDMQRMMKKMGGEGGGGMGGMGPFG
jgi:signal recognition particle subunit SRP54